MSGAREYFTMVSNLLSFETTSFLWYIVDKEVYMVSVFSKATFTWKKKRNSWDEVLTYRLRSSGGDLQSSILDTERSLCDTFSRKGLLDDILEKILLEDGASSIL